MSNTKKITGLAMASVLATGLTACATNGAQMENQATAKPMAQGYQNHAHKSAEAKCGEAKCGGVKSSEAKCGEAKCGGKTAHASCGGHTDKNAHASCGAKSEKSATASCGGHANKNANASCGGAK